MKDQIKRRAGALILALALTLSLVPPAWADPGDPELSITVNGEVKSELSLTVGEEVKLELKWDTSAPEPSEGEITYAWSIISVDGAASSSGSDDENDFTIKADKAGKANIQVKASWTALDGVHTVTATFSLTVTEPASTTVPVTGVTLDRTSLSLTVGGSETLTATVAPANATTRTVSWSSSDTSVATVSGGKVTAVRAGSATITVTTQDGGHTATCAVTVTNPAVTGLTFVNGGSSIVRSNSDPKEWDLSVVLSPSESVPGENDTIVWTVMKMAGDDEDGLEILSSAMTARGSTARLRSNSPGEYTVTATYNGTLSRSIDVKVSGITLSWKPKTPIFMTVGESRVIAVDQAYGFAENSSTADVVWSSSDNSVVTVMNGELTAWKIGTAIITANKNGYIAQCEVEVGEDEDAIAGPYSASTGNPLILSTIFGDLNQISLKKTETEDIYGTTIAGSPLNYINNLKVSTAQGTLYYNYNSEANTGEGVGFTERYAMTASGPIRSLSTLYFVPKQGFIGTAEISFTGWAQNGASFTGIIRVNVTGVNQISYRTQAGEPVWFQPGDFNAYFRNRTGRDMNYVNFNLPPAGQGVLYYNYAGGSGDPVTTSIQFSRSGRYPLDDVCFVPNAAFVGTATISFRGVDTSGAAVSGEVVVNVTQSSSAGNSANVYISGERGKPVTLQINLFNAACQATLRDTLSYVTFKLPALNEGTLYYNYKSASNPGTRVVASTRYYYSGVPSINDVTFIPASNEAGRIAVSYTGYGSAGTTFTGTLYISLGEADRTTVRYFVPKNGSVSFSIEDFNTAGLYQMGVGVDYVEFEPPDTGLGTLYYNYRGDDDSDWLDSSAYYRNPKEDWQRRLDLISFRAGNSAGSVVVPYTAYSSAAGDDDSTRQSFTGSVVIQVGAPAPADINLSCNTSGQAWLSGYDMISVCRPVMDNGLSYIEITNVPAAGEGYLYLSYNGFGTGTVVKKGDRFYCVGSPNIDQLSFIPHAGFTGKAVITYIGYSSDAREQVSGQVLVNVTGSGTSRYFNDMGNYVWAIDSVDYLYQNSTVEGVGGGRFNPSGTITKGDFTLMLVRAFGFTASGSVSFKDVPAGSYYADAIRVAALLGFGSSSNGNYYPKVALSRQDAMVMVYNALRASGRTVTNGLAIDLSSYRDEGDIAPYARAAMGSLVQMGVVKGVGNGYLKPRTLLNRAETAMLLHTIMTL